jgi:hypothetical protein
MEKLDNYLSKESHWQPVKEKLQEIQIQNLRKQFPRLDIQKTSWKEWTFFSNSNGKVSIIFHSKEFKNIFSIKESRLTVEKAKLEKLPEEVKSLLAEIAAERIAAEKKDS